MLTHNFNSLDLAFVKAWSKYNIHADIEILLEEIKPLALQKQPNAIALWYKYNKIGACKPLDKMMLGYKVEDFEDMIANGYYEKQVRKEEFTDIMTKFEYLLRNTDKRMQNLSLLGSRSEKEYLCTRLAEGVEDLKNDSYILNFKKAYNCIARELNKESTSNLQKLIFLARKCEVLQAYERQLPLVPIIENDKKSMRKQIVASMKKCLTLFEKADQEFHARKQNSLNYPQFYFAYANLMTEYAKIKGGLNKKLKSRAQTIFSQLATLYSPSVEEEHTQE